MGIVRFRKSQDTFDIQVVYVMLGVWKQMWTSPRSILKNNTFGRFQFLITKSPKIIKHFVLHFNVMVCGKKKVNTGKKSLTKVITNHKK